MDKSVIIVVVSTRSTKKRKRGFMANFPSTNKFLDLIKSAEIFVEEQKKTQLVKAEEARLAAELKAKQEAEAKAAADKAAADQKAKQEADAKAAADLKAKQEADDSRVSELSKDVQNFKKRMQDLEESKLLLSSNLKDQLSSLPNIPHDDVPEGLDENSNIQIKEFGNKTKPSPNHLS